MRECCYFVLTIPPALLSLLITMLVFKCGGFSCTFCTSSHWLRIVSTAVLPCESNENSWLTHCSFVSLSGCRLSYLGCPLFCQSGCLERLQVVVLGSLQPTNSSAITILSFLTLLLLPFLSHRDIPTQLHLYQSWHFYYSFHKRGGNKYNASTSDHPLLI